MDAALFLGMAHGGWCPRGRLAEDGVIAAHYQLQETDSPDYSERTERNVLESDATLLLCRGNPSGGTVLTLRLARRLRKPLWIVNLAAAPSPAATAQWLARIAPRRLNVAGPRESQSPGIAAEALKFLCQLWGDADG